MAPRPPAMPPRPHAAVRMPGQRSVVPGTEVTGRLSRYWPPHPATGLFPVAAAPAPRAARHAAPPNRSSTRGPASPGKARRVRETRSVASPPGSFFFNDTATSELCTLSLHDAELMSMAAHDLDRDLPVQL